MLRNEYRGLQRRNIGKWIRRAGLICVSVLSGLASLAAQTQTGRVLGNVLDQAGAAVVAAQITVTDVQRGTYRSVSTDASGEYFVPELIPGTYKVMAEAKGFKSIARLGVELEVGKDSRVDFSLSPGEATQTITVSGDAPLVETTNDTLGGTLSNEQINELPLNGRNYENLLTLRPGVMRYPGGGFDTTSTNGIRPEDNIYLIDGLIDISPYSGQSVINGAGGRGGFGHNSAH